MDSYETELRKLAQNTAEVIGDCQDTAKQEGIQLMAYALEHAKTNVSNMLDSSIDREKEFESFLDLLAVSLGADKTRCRNEWITFQTLPYSARHITFTDFYDWITSNFDDQIAEYLGSVDVIKNSWHDFQNARLLDKNLITEWCKWVEKNDSEGLIMASAIQNYWNDFLKGDDEDIDF
jgi:hypothetical protein